MSDEASAAASGGPAGRAMMMVSADRGVVAGERGPFYYMLEEFSRHWERVDVIGTRPAKVERTTVFGNVHLHHPSTGKLAQAGFIARTGRALAAERAYDVITSHDYDPFYNGLGSWRISKATGIPYVAEIHHVPGHPRAANLRERFDLRATRVYVRWALRRAAGFRVVNSGELPALLRGWGVPDERIHVLPSLYLDRDVFRPADGPRPEPECDVLLVGRLVPNKGVASLLEAVRRLHAEGLPLRLRLLGRGPLARDVAAFARRHRLGHAIEHVEWVEDAVALAEVYRRARVLVCASTSEGGPRVVPEAMACGTPAISTAVGIVPELIDTGTNGLVYDGSTEGLVAALRRTFGEPGLLEAFAARLPPTDMARFDRTRVIADLAHGLLAIAASAREPRGH